jgi:hypothetical protein
MHDGHEADQTPPDAGTGHETRDISTRVVATFGASLLAGGLIVVGVIALLYQAFAREADRAYPREFPMASVGRPPLPPEPRLQTRPREDLQRMRAEEDRILNSYGWVDARLGLVRIPIARAMAMAVDQGLPARAGAAPYAAPELPDKANSGRTPAPGGR